MYGICCTIGNKQQLLVEDFISQKANSFDALKILQDEYASTNLITEATSDWIKKAIRENNSSLVRMLSADNKQKLHELALIDSNMWRGWSELKVHILPHTFDPQINTWIEHYANEWAPYSGIQFTFTNKLPADIIIEVNGLGVHSSLIGKDAIHPASQNNITMRLGIGVATEQEAKRPIIHEFGHALGCIHEHQSPAAGIKWNRGVVIRSYAFAGWDEQMVEHNVFKQYASSKITNSHFDPKSIMLYPIPEGFTTNGFVVDWNTDLSPADKAFIRKAYGR
jgi:hypothetical protein